MINSHLHRKFYSLTATSNNGEICINLRDLSPTETYFMMDKSYPNLNSAALIGYDASWKLSNGTTIFNKNIYTDFDMTLINLQSNDRATLQLKKAQHGANYDYVFDIVNNREVQGFTIISVTVKAKRKTTSQPTPPRGGGSCEYIGGVWMCMDPLSTPYQSPLSYNEVLLGEITFSGLSQCHALNRPPSPAPYAHDGSGKQFNLNQALRDEQAWQNRAKLVYSPLGYQAALYQRLYQAHKTNGIYDVKSNASPWHGDADFGNFLFGAIMGIHGFGVDGALRFSAAYQGIQDHNSKFNMQSISLGIYNFLLNTGDGEGDPEMVFRGVNYAEEIHRNNPSDTKSLSCVDQKTMQGTNSGGSGGSDGGSAPRPYYGTLIVSCELWYFPYRLANGNFYMEKNCRFSMLP